MGIGRPSAANMAKNTSQVVPCVRISVDMPSEVLKNMTPISLIRIGKLLNESNHATYEIFAAVQGERVLDIQVYAPFVRLGMRTVRKYPFLSTDSPTQTCSKAVHENQLVVSRDNTR